MSELIRTFRETESALITTLNTFSDGDFNRIPFPGSWTPAQVADHILKSQANFTDLTGGNTETTARNPEEKKEEIKENFLDFDTKMKSPDFILPSELPQEKEFLIKRIQAESKKITEGMNKYDLTKTCLDFELPGSGKFTGLEWGWFIIYHTQRHIHQLENILKHKGN